MKRQQETKLQSDCFLWFVANYGMKKHNPRYLMYLQPNETASALAGALINLGVSQKIISQATTILMRNLISTGFREGASDNVIIAPNKVYFVEFKLPNNDQQPNQIEFETWVTNLGHTYVVIKSVEQFKEWVQTCVISHDVQRNFEL